MAEEFVMVPVPRKRVTEVYALLGETGRKGPARAARKPARKPGRKPARKPAPKARKRGRPPAKAPRAKVKLELIPEAVKAAPPAFQKVALTLAERPGERVPAEELTKAAGLAKRQLSGVIGAFGRGWKNRYKGGGPLFPSTYDRNLKMKVFTVTPEVAKAIRSALTLSDEAKASRRSTEKS